MKRCCHQHIPEIPHHAGWIYVWVRCRCGTIITRYHYGEDVLVFDSRNAR